MYQSIAEEHAKQSHWREMLKIEKQQLDKVKEKETKDQTAREEKSVLDRKTKFDIELNKEDNQRRALVKNMSMSVAAGDSDATLNIAKTLNEFLSK